MLRTGRAVSAVAVAAGMVGIFAVPSNAAVVPVKATVIGTSTHATTAKMRVTPGKIFTISAWVTHGTRGLNGQKLVLLERSGPTQKWVKATNLSKDAAVTSTTAKGARGYVQFTGIEAFKHSEQYKVWHPKQTVSGKVYGPSTSKVIAVAR